MQGVEGEDPEDISVNPKLAMYQGIYGGTLGLILVFGAIKSLVFMKVGWCHMCFVFFF